MENDLQPNDEREQIQWGDLPQEPPALRIWHAGMDVGVSDQPDVTVVGVYDSAGRLLCTSILPPKPSRRLSALQDDEEA